MKHRDPKALSILRERPEHAPHITALHCAAFGGRYEADLVERLRRDGLVIGSLVAAENEEIVGHILFSRLAVEIDGRMLRAAALAPLAVRPERQGCGIGSLLVREGLAEMTACGCEAVIVLGHAQYYSRFGFSAALASKLAAPFRGDSFMALELKSSALAGARGSVSYPAAFGLSL